MKIRRDGSVQASATPTYQNAGRREDNATYRCVVVKVVYTDDSANITTNALNPRVLYDCIVLGGFAEGQKISNCRLSSDLGGNNSFWERTLQASSKDPSKFRLSELDGDIVYVQFNQGHTGSPVIIALDNGIKTTGIIGAKKAEGPRSIRQFNGVRKTINKDGEVTTEVFGGTPDSEHGAFKANTSALATFSTTKDEKHVRKFKSGLTITEDGKNDKVTVSTAGGATAEIDGKSGKITISKGATQVVIDGNSDKISLKSAMIDLGASVSDFVTMFTELATAFNTHTHAFTDITPGGPVPSVTQPPLAPLPASVGSQTVKVQS